MQRVKSHGAIWLITTHFADNRPILLGATFIYSWGPISDGLNALLRHCYLSTPLNWEQNFSMNHGGDKWHKSTAVYRQHLTPHHLRLAHTADPLHKTVSTFCYSPFHPPTPSHTLQHKNLWISEVHLLSRFLESQKINGSSINICGRKEEREEKKKILMLNWYFQIVTTELTCFHWEFYAKQLWIKMRNSNFLLLKLKNYFWQNIHGIKYTILKYSHTAILVINWFSESWQVPESMSTEQIVLVGKGCELGGNRHGQVLDCPSSAKYCKWRASGQNFQI